MAKCQSDQYPKEGRCCKRCPAGKYVKADCDATKETECGDCDSGFYTATINHMLTCQRCRDCKSERQTIATECTRTTDAVCGCVNDYFCSNELCDHCQRLTTCKVGEGVKVPANRTSNAICAPCKEGTYSNVTDSYSPCKAHTRCEELGREQRTPGTTTTDAVCGGYIPRCSWELPAILWSGLVLTALILFAIVICRRAKRKLYKAAKPSVPVTLMEVPKTLVTSLDLPLPSTELNDHYQESCITEECKLPLYNTDDNLVSNCDISLPITPLKASVSFAESNHNNGSVGFRPNNFLRTYSEPQEDEWCGV
ncbi:tumor necrosis factor receptor superfamily member 5-like [Lates japonicus]|uniref:Tumor necrosis factor receptor superfamily member 5-like protein n=1 Tax=Lates japonicus TaxID=270547 RepID=A0AAD3MZ05_LATJO|nr:tumor necrosis factor receptor superfamily member 5-like protein [Lates japonicus]